MSDSKNLVRAIIPAAGKGTRLNCSDVPKAMYEVCGKPLLEMVLENTDFISPENIYIVVGYKKEKIIGHFGEKYNYVEQKEQLGTGHAVNVCAGEFADFDGTVLVTFGDMPMFRKEILKEICERHTERKAACTLLTAYNPNLDNWAKVIRDENGRFKAIVEGKDCTPEQNRLGELFAGVLVFDSKALFATLPKLSRENAQNEYYLTDVPRIMSEDGLTVDVLMTDDPDDLTGVNTPSDIEACEKIIKKRR